MVVFLGRALSPGQAGGRTIKSAQRGPFVWLFSGCGCIIWRDAICLRPAKLRMWQDRWMMGSETQPVLLRRQSGARSQSYAAGRARRKNGSCGADANGEWRGSQSPGDTIYGTCWPWLIKGRGGNGGRVWSDTECSGGREESHTHTEKTWVKQKTKTRRIIEPGNKGMHGQQGEWGTNKENELLVQGSEENRQRENTFVPWWECVRSPSVEKWDQWQT